MGRRNQDQARLFYEFNLDEAVPDDHLVRKNRAVLHLSWIYGELAPYDSRVGRPSIDPVLMIRMLIVGYVFASRSERQLCRGAPGPSSARAKPTNSRTYARPFTADFCNTICHKATLGVRATACMPSPTGETRKGRS